MPKLEYIFIYFFDQLKALYLVKLINLKWYEFAEFLYYQINKNFAIKYYIDLYIVI